MNDNTLKVYEIVPESRSFEIRPAGYSSFPKEMTFIFWILNLSPEIKLTFLF